MLLAYAPLRLIWQMKLKRADVIRLTAVFCSVFVCTGVGIWRVYAFMYIGGPASPTAAMIESFVTLIISNAVVLPPLFHRNNDKGVIQTQTDIPMTTVHLDLSHLGSSSSKPYFSDTSSEHPYVTKSPIQHVV